MSVTTFPAATKIRRFSSGDGSLVYPRPWADVNDFAYTPLSNPASALGNEYGNWYTLNTIVPTQASAIATQSFSSSTTHNVTMPATVAANDLLWVMFVNNNASITQTIPTNWNRIANDPASTGSRIGFYYKVAVGNEDGTNVNFATSSAAVASSIRGHFTAGSYTGIPVAGTAATATSVSPNPPSLTSGFGNFATIFMALAASNSVFDSTPFPADYFTPTFEQTQATAAAALAQRGVILATDDPGVFDLAASNPWVAQTVAFKGIVSLPEDILITAVNLARSGTTDWTQAQIQLGVGAVGAEVPVGEFRFGSLIDTQTVPGNFRCELAYPIYVPAGSTISARMAADVTTQLDWRTSIEAIAVDDVISIF